MQTILNKEAQSAGWVVEEGGSAGVVSCISSAAAAT